MTAIKCCAEYVVLNMPVPNGSVISSIINQCAGKIVHNLSTQVKFINIANGLFSYQAISRQTIIFWSKFCEKSSSDSTISMI